MDSSNFHVLRQRDLPIRVSIWSDECHSGFFIYDDASLTESQVFAKHGEELTAKQFMDWIEDKDLDLQDILKALREINGRS